MKAKEDPISPKLARGLLKMREHTVLLRRQAEIADWWQLGERDK